MEAFLRRSAQGERKEKGAEGQVVEQSAAEATAKGEVGDTSRRPTMAPAGARSATAVDLNADRQRVDAQHLSMPRSMSPNSKRAKKEAVFEARQIREQEDEADQRGLRVSRAKAL